MMRTTLTCALLTFFALHNATAQDLNLRWRQLPSLPGTPGLASPFAGVSNDVLLVAGGANFPDAPPWKGGRKVWHDRIYGLIDGQWEVVGRLPHPCAYGVSFQTAEGILCAGGSDSAKHFADVFQLRWHEDRIDVEPMPSLPRPIANACGAMIGTVVYLAGGTESPESTTALATFCALDTAEPRPAWRELPVCPGPARMLPVATAHDNSFFLFSGASLSEGPDGKPVRSYLTDAWRFSTKEEQWTRLKDLPFAVVAAPSPVPVTESGQVLVLGGDDGTKSGFQPPEGHPGFSQQVSVYDIPRDRWTQGPALRASRVTVPVVNRDGTFVIASGEERPGIRSPEIWELSIQSDSE